MIDKYHGKSYRLPYLREKSCFSRNGVSMQGIMEGELITNNCINSSSKTYAGDQWVTAQFVALGDEVVQHIIEGDTVLTYYNLQIGGGSVSEGFPMKEGEKLGKGYISIQSETHPTEFRKIELMELEKGKER